MQQALDALENGKRVRNFEGGTKFQPPLEDAAITALRAQLEQPEQKQHQPWCDSVTKLLLSNPPQIPPCNCKQEPVTQPEQEPVALIRDGVLRWHIPHEHYSRPTWTAHGTHMLYAQPPQRKPLTDEDIEQAQRTVWRSLPSDFDYTTSSWIEIGIRYAEAAHGIGEKP